MLLNNIHLGINGIAPMGTSLLPLAAFRKQALFFSLLILIFLCRQSILRYAFVI